MITFTRPTYLVPAGTYRVTRSTETHVQVDTGQRLVWVTRASLASR